MGRKSSTTSERREHALRRRLRQGGTWTIVGRTAGMAIVLANYMFLAKATSRSDFAAFILISSIVSFLSMMASFGLNTLICRYLSESLGVGDLGRARKVLGASLVMGTLSTTVVGLAAYCLLGRLGTSVFAMPMLEQYAGMIAVWIVLLAASQLVAEAFRGMHDLRTASLLSGMSGGLVTNLLFLVGSLLVACFVRIDFYWISLLFILALATSTVVSGGYLIVCWQLRERQAKVSADEHALPAIRWIPLAREAWSLMLVQVLGFGLAQLDIWIVGMYCSPADLGVYGVARRLCLLVAVPLTQISLAISSSIAELYACGDRQNLQRVVRGASTVGALASGLPTLFLLLFAEFVLRVVFKESYVAGATTLRLLLIGQAVFAMTGPCGPTLLMTGHQRVNLWTALSVLPLYLLCPWVAGTWGLEGIAVIFSVALATQNLSQWIVVARMLGITTQPCFRPHYVRQLMQVGS